MRHSFRLLFKCALFVAILSCGSESIAHATEGCCQVSTHPGMCSYLWGRWSCVTSKDDPDFFVPLNCFTYTSKPFTRDPCPDRKRDDDVSNCKKAGDRCTAKLYVDHPNSVIEKYTCQNNLCFKPEGTPAAAPTPPSYEDS
jgi:hypothetical protein